jgi:hypothetical protein
MITGKSYFPFRGQQRRLFEVKPDLENWLLEAAEKPVSPLTKKDFDAIRKRVRARYNK